MSNRIIKILFAIQIGLILIGFAIQPDGEIFTTQWITWTLAGLISLVIGILAINIAIGHKKYEKFTIIAIALNIIAILVALYIHYNPNLG